jgi:hypothetical protein
MVIWKDETGFAKLVVESPLSYCVDFDNAIIYIDAINAIHYQNIYEIQKLI